MEQGRLVIADDSAEMRWLVRTAVGQEFAEVVEAADGRELLWTLLRTELRSPEGPPDVVVTDLYMPGYSGLDVIDAWRELHPANPWILITAFPDDAVARRAARLGATMLAKPFSTAQLRNAVHAALGGLP
ncbi:MAG: response regulator [Deltaproteobacteria bacterium]|nr:response regulator [Deltaproteobacteria bacterium]MCW5807370.1 response regulator [Deltaproteobacteria bacterium]